MQGKKRASNQLRNFDQNKVTKNQVYSGLLGIPVDGVDTVDVYGREDFVWVRLRNSSNEIIQAFNASVKSVYDLPVLVFYDPNSPTHYSIAGRDVGRYASAGGGWGGQPTNVPPHGASHSFPPTRTTGGDIVWVYSRQFMPFLVAPSGTAGVLGAILYPHYYYHSGSFHYAGMTGTPDLTPYKPLDNKARMILIVLGVNTGNMYIVTGAINDFAATVTGNAEVSGYIPSIPNTYDIPLTAVRLVSGTSTIQWENLYDVRQFFSR